MNDDLQEPRAAANWAMTQLEISAMRVEMWQHGRPYVLIADFDPQRGKQALRQVIRSPLPLTVNAEVGAIVNSLRSSLDLLMVVLACRNGVADPKDTYFPVAEDKIRFFNGATKRIKRLSAADKATIEGLEPYKGGNDHLYALHQMDIMRKHRRLVRFDANIQVGLAGAGLGAEFVDELPPRLRPKDKSILAWINPAAPDCKTEIAVEVTLVQGETLAPAPLIPALRKYGTLVHSIIDLFA